MLNWLKTRVLPKATKSLEERMDQDHFCPFCETHENLYAGPSGPGAQNVACGNCGAKYNFTMLGIRLLDPPQSPTPLGDIAKAYPSDAHVKAVMQKIPAD